ncbi:MAG: hypothetical protein Q4C47_07510, partial [Planctomycetia bacterium]|nr:hypothetical protein [Planctomycetia bacterium]
MWPLSDRTRRRWTLRLFFLVGMGPLVAVALGCLWLKFGPMATVLSQRWSWKLGAEISIREAIEPRPGTLRLTGVTIRSGETGRKLASVARIEITRSGTPDRETSVATSTAANQTNLRVGSTAMATRKNPVTATSSDRTVAGQTTPETTRTLTSSGTVYELELTAPTIDLSQRTELLRILEQALRTRCGGKSLAFRWYTTAMTLTYPDPSPGALSSRPVSVPLVHAHGSCQAGLPGTPTSHMEAFFSLDEPEPEVLVDPEILPPESVAGLTVDSSRES